MSQTASGSIPGHLHMPPQRTRIPLLRTSTSPLTDRGRSPLGALLPASAIDNNFGLPSTPSRETDAFHEEVKTEPSTPESPTLRTMEYRRALRRQRSARFLHAVLHYERAENDLTPWYWPVNEAGERVSPSDLLEYRRTHEFLGPSCLCASLDSLNSNAYMEAAIFLATAGPSTGRYVAACATGQCRYWVCIEHLYSQSGLLIKRFAARDATNLNIEPAPTAPLSQSSAARKLQSVEKHIGSTLDLVTQCPRNEATSPVLESAGRQPSTPDPFGAATGYNIPTFTPSSQTDSYFGLLMQLDSVSEPGVSEEVFQQMFLKCRFCRMYMSKRTTGFHKCELGELTPTPTPRVEVVDLTNED